MIEMSNPNDADIILLEVKDTADADVIIYHTEKREEWESWDCMWKVRIGGFSNFSFYLADSESDTLLFTDEGHHPIAIGGRVYFTDEKELRGYKNAKVHIDGIMIKRTK
jgi:hypothetical protein